MKLFRFCFLDQSELSKRSRAEGKDASLHLSLLRGRIEFRGAPKTGGVLAY